MANKREVDLAAKTTLTGADHVRIVGDNGISYKNLLSSFVSYIKGAIADATTSVSGWMSASDKTKLNGIDTGATKIRVKGNSEGTYRTGDVNITAANVGAVPTTRTVNSKALSSNISLTYTDVGAAAANHNHEITFTKKTVTSGSNTISANSTKSITASLNSNTTGIVGITFSNANVRLRSFSISSNTLTVVAENTSSASVTTTMTVTHITIQI